MLGLWRRSQRMMTSPPKRRARSLSKRKPKLKARRSKNAAIMENLISMSGSELRKRNRKGGLMAMRRKAERKAAALRESHSRKAFAPKVKAAGKKRASSPRRSPPPPPTGRGRGRGLIAQRVANSVGSGPVGRGRGKGKGRGKGAAPAITLAQLAANSKPLAVSNKERKHCIACGHSLATEKFYTETLAACRRCGLLDPRGEVWQYNVRKNAGNNNAGNRPASPRRSPRRNSPK